MRERPAWWGSSVALGLSLLLGACASRPAPAPRSSAPAADCPVPPPPLSMSEANEELTRFARETRADLMARLAGAAEPLAAEPLAAEPLAAEPLFVTLHPTGLALLEAVLAAPGRAERLEAPWLQSELLRTYVDLHSPGPLAALENDPPLASLIDEQGQRSTALYLTVHADAAGRRYRFYFDPLAIDRERERLQLSFELPLGGKPLRAAWRLTQTALQGMDELPLIFVLAKQRAVRLARWALLRGAREEARALLDEELRCTPDFPAARQLRHLLEQLDQTRGGPRRQLALSLAQLEAARRRGLLEELEHDPLADLNLRVALLERLLPLGRVGALPASALGVTVQALETAARRLSAGDIGWGLPAALTEFDRLLEQLLAAALDGEAVGSSLELAALSLAGVAPPPAPLVQRELEQRILRANYRLEPRWIKGPAAQRAASGQLSRLHLLELRPILAAQRAPTSPNGQAVAGLEQRLGWGWLHSGLPPAGYTVTFADDSASYWRQAVARTKTDEELKAIARRIVEREAFGPDAAGVALALQGFVALQGSAALAELLALAEVGSPLQAAAALEVLAAERDPRVTPLLARAAGAPEAARRAGALRALAARRQPAALALLRRGLTDPERSVAAAALAGLLRIADPAAIATARAWLQSKEPASQAQILELAASTPGLTVLGRDLRLQARRPAPSPLLPAALARVLGPASAPLFQQLYLTQRELRPALLEHAHGPAFLKLFERVLGEPEVTLRRSAAARLAELEAAPRSLLDRARGDVDAVVQLTAHVALARRGEVNSLLALGAGARGSCAERRLVLPVLCATLDQSSRGRLLLDALQSECQELGSLVWALVDRYRALDPALARAALGHPQRIMRIYGALRVLGLGALGGPPRGSP